AEEVLQRAAEPEDVDGQQDSEHGAEREVQPVILRAGALPDEQRVPPPAPVLKQLDQQAEVGGQEPETEEEREARGCPPEVLDESVWVHATAAPWFPRPSLRRP